MDNEFADRVILVTGGTGGLGTSVVNMFIKQNPKVLVIAHRTEKDKSSFSNLLDEGGKEAISKKTDTIVEFVKADVTIEDSVKAMITEIEQKYDKIDILANIVGGYMGGKSIEETTLGEFDFMININLKAAFLLTKYAISSMKLRSTGKIVHVSSASGVKAFGNDTAYSSSKAGLIRLVESVKEEVKNNLININCILPTIIDTKANREAMPHSDFSKWLDPNDLARVILYLCSDSSKSVNGAAIRTDGRT
jgi:NAD(P)-dependent dehydrogenase (short-subunit alcohol dehydrogenase family)